MLIGIVVKDVSFVRAVWVTVEFLREVEFTRIVFS